MGALAYEIETKTNRTIQELPKRNWKDKLLSIDRPREIAKLYKQAGTELTSALDKKASCFDKVANENISDIPHVLKQVVQNGRVVKVIASLPQELPEMAANYKQTLDAWIKSVQDMWTTGNQKVDAAKQKEDEEFIKVKDNVLPYMRGPRDRIYSNLKRLGIDTKYTPALP